MTPAQTVDDIRAGLEGVTPGEWQVIVDRHAWSLPSRETGGEDRTGEHIERRIATIRRNPQAKDFDPVATMSFGLGLKGQPARPMVHISEADAAHIARCSPARLLPVLEEFDRMRERIAALEAERDAARAELSHKADAAYCRSLDKFSSTRCLGWEQKVKEGSFGKTEMDAHAEANQLMGKHQAYADARAFLAKEK